MHEHKTETRKFSSPEEFEASLKEAFAKAPQLLAQVDKPVAYIIAILGEEGKDNMKVAFSSVGNQRLITQLAKEAYEHAQEDLRDQAMAEMPPELRSLLDLIQRKRTSSLDEFKAPTDPRSIN